MPEFLPFKALMPAKDPQIVAAPPYDVLSIDDCREILKKHKKSFVMVSRPEATMPEGIDPYSEEVYEQALTNFLMLKKTGPYIQDNQQAYYVYGMETPIHKQYGIAALASVADYVNGNIKQHEKTRKDKEDDRTRHILKIRSHSGPVLLTYKDDQRINKEVERVINEEKPFFNFTIDGNVSHKIWRITKDLPKLLQYFEEIRSFYIADGHHRAASAARVANIINAGHFKPGGHNYFVAVAFPASQMKIMPYNRCILDWNGQSKQKLLQFISSKFENLVQIQECKKLEIGQSHICLIVENEFYTFKIPENLKKKIQKAEEKLDVAILQNEILEPFFGICDPRTDKRIDFVGGSKSLEILIERVRENTAKLAFALHPVSINDVIEISDSGGIMPPKSTWFEPKLLDGLLLDEF